MQSEKLSDNVAGLCERLRSVTHNAHTLAICEEAAATLQSLAREVEQWERIWKDGHTVKSLSAQLTAAQAENAALRAKLEKAREGLEKISSAYSGAGIADHHQINLLSKEMVDYARSTLTEISRAALERQTP